MGAKDKPGELTRRGLFRSVGVAGTTAALASCRHEGEATGSPRASGPEAFGHTAAPLSFELDGAPISVDAEARTTLLELLRVDLDATGTKLVCDRGACGACLVLVDDVPRNSCMVLAHDVDGARVQTVASLGGSGRLSPLQQAFVAHDALQCGFCTSGMLISTTALLARRRPGDPPLRGEQVRDAIAGNLCRCGTYPNVVAAVLSIANPGSPDMPSPTVVLSAGEPEPTTTGRN